MPIRILLVDDDALVRDGLRMRLALGADFEVVGDAKNGAMALRLAEALDPDMVLMDLLMPELDGIRATEVLRRRSAAAGVVALSLYDSPAERTRARQAGAAFVGKHEPETALWRAIRKVAQQSRAARGGGSGAGEGERGQEEKGGE